MTASELIVSRHRRLGRIRLNRPEALNSLTLDMVRLFTRALMEFRDDPGIVAVLVSGEGERGLCAGGDIRRLYGLRGGDQSHYRTFWREEYRLNALIADFPKPYVVWMDGLVMGGGVGVSAHGDYRIVTERTRLAMPEVCIGFIPDVGGTWLLSRAGGLGFYLALSGAAVSGGEAIDAGLADLKIESGRFSDLVERLTDIDAATEVDTALEGLRLAPDHSGLVRHKKRLDAAMSADNLAAALGLLAEDGGDFARRAVSEINRNSPTSLKATFALLRRAAAADRLEDCLVSEYRAACRLLQGHDLYEGIRAAIIDKDRQPNWSPPALDEVSDADIVAILAGDGSPEPVFPKAR
jgi:enoyl-CoA hydratase